MKTQLLTKKGTGKALAKFFNVSEQTVSAAINGKYDTALTQAIRKIAVEKYGAIIVEIPQGKKSEPALGTNEN